jgi:hypothetical protein
MRHKLTRALLRSQRHRLRTQRHHGVEFRSQQSPRDVLIGLPLRPLADALAGMVKITAIQGRP